VSCKITSATVVGLIFLFLNLVSSLFKSKSRLEAENVALRQQLTVLQRKVRGRVQFTNSDRLFFIQLYRWFPAILKAMTIIRPETLVRWHRALKLTGHNWRDHVFPSTFGQMSPGTRQPKGFGGSPAPNPAARPASVSSYVYRSRALILINDFQRPCSTLVGNRHLSHR